jgi:hypothetical protein
MEYWIIIQHLYIMCNEQIMAISISISLKIYQYLV